uniref:Mismatch repair endonuclease PMS2 n=1 Tax=Timema monikensis TaxID=170555 RepID=A0A7R9E7C8_9NEOP|nr:unnamed protein product [Timema monikensis]
MEIEFASSATTEKSGMIQAINKDTVHQICSGQVVLNLATAVKELVENSLDAGATSIDIRLKEFGSELIEVTDNGCGVEEHNFQGLTLKHHTSKLREFSDLTTVETFGFRGEALSSLCALSNLTIITCHKGAPCGTKLEFDHKGLITSCRSHARQVGTTVILQNLFSCLPVRQKEFHRNLRREFSKMANLLYAYCLVSTGVNQVSCVPISCMLIVWSPLESSELCSNRLYAYCLVPTGVKSVVFQSPVCLLSGLYWSKVSCVPISCNIVWSVLESSELRSNLLYAYCLVSIWSQVSCVPISCMLIVWSLLESSELCSNLLYANCLVSTGVTITCVNQNNKGGRTMVVTTEGSSSVRENIAAVFGTKQLQTILDLPTEPPEDEVLKELGAPPQMVEDKDLFQLEGCVSSCAHGAGRAASDRQFYYINSRPCEPTKVIFLGLRSSAQHEATITEVIKLINEVYHQFNKHQFPFVFINLKTSRHNVDVNVTPDKRQVFLDKEKLILATVKACLLKIYEGVTSTLPMDNCANETSPPTPGGLHTMLKQWGRDPGTPLGRGLKRALQQTPGRNRGTPKQLCMSDFIKRSSVSPSDSLENTSNTDIEENHTLQQESSADHLINSLQQESSADPIINSLQQETSADHLINGLQQETSAAPIINSSQQETSAAPIINILQQETRVYPIINSLQQETSANHLLNKLQVPYSNGVKHNSYNSATKIGMRQISETTMERNLRLSEFRLPQTAGKEHSSVAKATCSFQLVPTTIASSDDPAFIEEATGSSVNDESSAVESCGAVLPQEVESIEKLQTDETRETHTVRPLSQVSMTLDNVRRLLESREKRRNRWTAAPVVNKFHADINPSKNTIAEQELKKEISKDMFAKMSIVGQFNLGFIVVRLRADLFIIDQHASDEKYNFEKLQRETALRNQRLVIPQKLELTAVNEGILIENVEIFHNNGFDFLIDKEGKVSRTESSKRVQLTAIPMSKNWHFGKEDIDELLFMLQWGFIVRAVLNQTWWCPQDSPHTMCRPSRVRAMFASRACRKSVMIGTALNLSDMRRLVDHMGEMDQPWVGFIYNWDLPFLVSSELSLGSDAWQELSARQTNHEALGQPQPHSRLAHTAFNYQTLGQPQPLSRLAHTAFNYQTLGQPQPHSRLAHTAFNYQTRGQPQPHSRLAHTAFNYQTLGQPQPHSRLAHTAFNYQTRGQPQPLSRLAHTAFNYQTLGQPQPLSRLAHTAFNYEARGQPQPLSRLAHTAFNYEALGQPQLHS